MNLRELTDNLFKVSASSLLLIIFTVTALLTVGFILGLISGLLSISITERMYVVLTIVIYLLTPFMGHYILNYAFDEYQEFSTAEKVLASIGLTVVSIPAALLTPLTGLMKLLTRWLE